MIEFVLEGGIVMWPLAVVGVGILWIAVRTSVRIRRGTLDDARFELQAILFWGGTSLLLGVLGTVMGLVVMTQAAALAGSVEPQLVWGGVGASLVSLICGVVLFLLSIVLWFTLRQWHHRTVG